jgi:Rieske Fe-S protein
MSTAAVGRLDPNPICVSGRDAGVRLTPSQQANDERFGMFAETVPIPRQKIIAGAGLAVAATALAACSSGGGTQVETGESTTTEGTSAPAPAPAGNIIAKTSDVPVGSGVIVDDTVVTQPSAGVFKGFSATCTHKGCTVAEVLNGTINCPCHGSKFNLDGSVAHGPATRPLDSKAVTVEGDSIVLG